MHLAHLLLILFFGKIVSAVSSIEYGLAEDRREVPMFVFTVLARNVSTVGITGSRVQHGNPGKSIKRC